MSTFLLWLKGSICCILIHLIISNPISVEDIVNFSLKHTVKGDDTEDGF